MPKFLQILAYAFMLIVKLQITPIILRSVLRYIYLANRIKVEFLAISHDVSMFFADSF